MDAVYEVLSSTSLSTNIISICVSLLVMLVFAHRLRAHKLSRYRYKTRRKVERRKRVTAYVTRKESLEHQHRLSKFSNRLEQVVEDLINTQYVISDRKEYASALQTPLRDNLQQLRAIANQLKSPSSIETQISHNNTYHRHMLQKLDLGCIFDDILPSLHRFAESRGMQFVADDAVECCLQTPPGMVDKILRKLLLNAMMHNPADTKILLKCSLRDKSVIFEVIDNGRGLVHRVSSLQKRGSIELQAYRRFTDGETILTLPAISQLIKQFGGAFSISTAINWGTHIRLSVPISSTAPMPGKEQTKKYREHHRVLNGKNVVVVSHQSKVTNTIKQYLSDQYSVRSFNSFDGALQYILSNITDMIIVDFAWQDVLTVQLCEFLKASRNTSMIPVLMLTSATDPATRTKAYKQGVTAIIEKPLLREELRVLVGKFIHQESRPAMLPHQHHPSMDTAEPEALYTIKNKNRFIERFKAVVDEHFQDDTFCRGIAAAQLNMSEKTLQRRMSEHFDTSFREYLKRYRLYKAKNAMQNGASITVAAFDAGFSSTSYFGQCFKQEFGVVPSMLNMIIENESNA